MLESAGIPFLASLKIGSETQHVLLYVVTGYRHHHIGFVTDAVGESAFLPFKRRAQILVLI